MAEKILVTGAGGYLGKGLCESLSRSFQLRLMDQRPYDARGHERVIGDVTMLEEVRSALHGTDGLVIAHMASRQAGSYDTPGPAIDANVKGTANLFSAAVEAGIERVVLISSCGVVYGYPDREFFEHNVPPRGNDLYTITKQCQEVLAEFHHREHGLQVAALRIGGLLYEDTMVNKYGDRRDAPGENTVDPNDVGEVARLCLLRESLAYETFFVMGVRHAAEKYDVAYTERTLGWEPTHRFGT